MNINRNNYEIWFLDYFEGRLDPEQVKALMAFLELHYDLKEEFDSFENISLPPAKHIVFDAKDSLKKKSVITVGDINAMNYEDFFIAETEGDLSKEQSEQLALFIVKNPQLKKDFELFCKIKIFPDDTIKFDAKQSLKKNVIIPVGSIDGKNYAEYFIAAMEGDLELAKLADLKEFLNKNPQLHKEYSLFGQTKLSIDTAIVFNRKQQLKKKEPVRIYKLKRLYYPVSIAASVLLLVGFYFLFNKTEVNKVYTADRNDIHFSRNVHKISQPVKNEISNFQNTYATISKENISKTVKEKTTEFRDFQYASLIKPNAITEDDISTQIEPEDIYSYTATLAALQIKAAKKSETKKEGNALSLKEFAMLGIKKSLTAKDKRDKVTPKDKLSIWDLAYAGVNKIDNLTGAKAVIDHKDNNNYTFALGNNIEFSRSSNR